MTGGQGGPPAGGPMRSCWPTPSSSGSSGGWTSRESSRSPSGCPQGPPYWNGHGR